MSAPGSPLTVLAVSGSLKGLSVTRTVVRHCATLLENAGCVVELLDLQQEPLKLFNPDNSCDEPEYEPIRTRVLQADAFLLGTPDYHGGPSGVLKNFLDYFWHEFAGKLFGTVVASHEKGLTVTDQLRTVLRQCYAWTLPYGVSVAEKADVQNGRIVNEELKKRLQMMTRDLRVYGELLARQRRADLACGDSCFMARHRT